MNATFCFKCVIVVLMYLGMSADPVNGSSCTNNTHTCTTGTQRCVEQNNTAGFVCECTEIDQQLDPLGNCTAIPESQRLYITVPLNISGVDRNSIVKTINDPKFAELAERMLQIRNLPSYKGLKFLNARLE
ncbi:hypothetical protein V1264_008124 [Littorina saxatilis]|uniref:EGF-like domain-containing protein n=2 Tax=Littorina saxatilis TaxID=31220 RepID=A0AAN9G2J4_9CAEN